MAACALASKSFFAFLHAPGIGLSVYFSATLHSMLSFSLGFVVARKSARIVLMRKANGIIDISTWVNKYINIISTARANNKTIKTNIDLSGIKVKLLVSS